MLSLFPLSQPLFPDGLLSLRVFEVRYLSLIEQCQKASLPFGVVALREGHEIQTPGVTESIYSVGCLAQITEVRQVQPGLLAVQCIGGDRFRIETTERDELGLWHAQVEMLASDIPTDIPPDLQSIANKLGALIADSQRQGVEHRLPITRPYRLDECGWVANQWAHMLTLSTDQKLSLLEENDPLTRLTAIKILLDHPGQH